MSGATTPSGSDEPFDLELMMRFAARGPEVDETLARGLLAAALARHGHSALVENDLTQPVTKPQSAGALGALLLCWSSGSFIGAEAHLSPVLWPVLAIGVCVLLAAAISQAQAIGGTLIVACLVGWPVTLVVLANSHRSSDIWATHLVPVALALVTGLLTRRLPLRDAQDVALAMSGVVRGAPLLAPLVLVFLFLPALNSDVWLVGDKLSQGRVIGVLALSVGVLLMVVRSQLRGELRTVLAQRARQLCGTQDRGEATRRAAVRASEPTAVPLVESFTDEALDGYWPQEGEEYVPFLDASERDVLLTPLAVRLVLTTIVIGAVLTAYIYLLTVVTVPTSVAHVWLSHVVRLQRVHVLFTLWLPFGPYLRVASMLGTVATATFLGFVMIDDRFAAALTDALLGAPVDRFLVLALPYVALAERNVARPSHEPGVGGPVGTG